MSALDALARVEAKARAEFEVRGWAAVSVMIGGELVTVIASSAMVNRGSHTGRIMRLNYKLGGKRIAAGQLARTIEERQA